MKWLDRTLVESPVYYALCTDEEAFKQELGRLGIEDVPRWLMASAAATTHYLHSDEHEADCAIVCLGPTDGATQAEIYALLVHEAVHVWQKIRAVLGEDWPSSEFEAYSMQSITMALFAAYRDAIAGDSDDYRGG